MYLVELFFAILQALMNLALSICMIPFIPIVWLIREIKGVKPVVKNTMKNCPKINLTSNLDKHVEDL